MKFKYIVSFSVGFSLAAAIFFGIKMPGNAGKYNIGSTQKEIKKRISPAPEITVFTDSVYVSNENFDQVRATAAGGLFVPSDNSVHVSYFYTDSKDKKIKDYCYINNVISPMVFRHEMEHARKAALTKLTFCHSPFSRAKIAAVNEIMAPAAEIIESLDYRFLSGRPYPLLKIFVRDADSEIMRIMCEDKMDWPVNFNNQKIADVVLKYSTQRFLGELRRGVYRSAIVREATKPSVKYTPNNKCDMRQCILFNPQFDCWGPMFQFDAVRGPVNIWDSASMSAKMDFINTLDSVVFAVAGKNQLFFNFGKIR